MVTIAATSSATPSLQSTLIRSRLEAARSDAAQAESRVQTLRAQVDAAESAYAARADKVRALSNQSSQTDPTYQTQVQTSQSAVPTNTQTMVFGLYNATSAKRQATGNGLKTDPNAAPVLNTQRQATGRIVNISA